MRFCAGDLGDFGEIDPRRDFGDLIETRRETGDRGDRGDLGDLDPRRDFGL
jgi:hypothetical protein